MVDGLQCKVDLGQFGLEVDFQIGFVGLDDIVANKC